MAFPDAKPNPNQRRDEDLVRLMRHLFHKKFCPAESIEEADKPKVLTAYFCGWLDRHMSMSMDAHTECEAAGVDDDTWQFAVNLLDSGTAPEALFGVWYTIVLSERPDPKHELYTMNVVCNLTFKDGTISTSQAFVSREMMEGPGFNDNLAASILRNNMRQLLDMVVTTGLDKLHDQAGVNTFTTTEAEDPFHVLMGWIIKHMLRGEPMPGKLKPGLIKPVENYMRLAQQCIRPPIPDSIIAEFHARQKHDAAANAGKPRGGWDV